MKLSDFKYTMPKTAIAKYPIKPRDNAKLLVFQKNTTNLEHKKFKNVVDYMSKGDVLVVNQTKSLKPYK